MQTAAEITSNLKNLRYYSQKISELARQQFELDYDRGKQLGVHTGSGSIRFDSMGAIMSACTMIGVYCDNIKSNLDTAITQDKLLHLEEEED